MKLVDPAAAVRAIPDGATAIFPGGCAEPTLFYRTFAAEVERFSRLTVCAGFSFDGSSAKAAGATPIRLPASTSDKASFPSGANTARLL